MNCSINKLKILLYQKKLLTKCFLKLFNYLQYNIFWIFILFWYGSCFNSNLPFHNSYFLLSHLFLHSRWFFHGLKLYALILRLQISYFVPRLSKFVIWEWKEVGAFLVIHFCKLKLELITLVWSILINFYIYLASTKHNWRACLSFYCHRCMHKSIYKSNITTNCKVKTKTISLFL